MKKFLLLLILCIIISGCSNSNKNELDDILNQNQYIIVDVRTKEEYKENHIVGAINIPYDQINKNINLDKNKMILVYCKSGNRSKIAYNKLINLGYNVKDLGAFSKIYLPKE